jgi:MFS family permease
MSLVFVFCALAVAFSFTPLSSSKPVNRARELDKYARRLGVAVPSDGADRLVARLIRRERALMIGGLTGIALATLIAWVLPGGFDAAYVPVLIFAGLGVGSASGAALASARSALQPLTGQRIARPTTPIYADYVPPLERWSGRILPGLALGAVLAAWIAFSIGVLGDARLSTAYIWGSAGAWLAYAAVAGLLVSALLSRRILDRGQPSASATELAWNDGLRAQALRDLQAVPVTLGFVSLLSTFFDIGSLSDYAGGGATAALVGLGLLAVLTAAGVVLLIVNISSKPQQHYWRRLWSERAIGGSA